MIKNISQTRRIYERTYQMLRVKGYSWLHETERAQLDDAQEGALFSYDFYDQVFSGWINPDRGHKWFIAAQARTFREDWFRK